MPDEALISRALAYEAVRRGKIPLLRIGRRILVPRRGFARLFAVQRSLDTPDRRLPEAE